jgi:hypothetical protein
MLYWIYSTVLKLQYTIELHDTSDFDTSIEQQKKDTSSYWRI